jgi:outer membrane protein assembly factor BamB
VSGAVRWTFETSDHIYSSPALGHDSSGRTNAIYIARNGREHREILYVGSSNGKLYALNADTGRRRWSYDTTPSDPTLRDRNDRCCRQAGRS